MFGTYQPDPKEINGFQEQYLIKIAFIDNNFDEVFIGGWLYKTNTWKERLSVLFC